MNLRMIIDLLNCNDILDENENMSLPLLDFVEEDYMVLLFTYSFSFDWQENTYEILWGKRIAYDPKEQHIEVTALPEEVPSIKKLVFETITPSEAEEVTYEGLIQLTDKMLASGFARIDVQNYAEAFNAFVSEHQVSMYLLLGEDYFKRLNDILEIKE